MNQKDVKKNKSTLVRLRNMAILIAVSLLVGLAIGCYIGYDIGFEKAVRIFAK